ncbi:hypothetical protein TorRG33x02_068510 [Trema orientale]|uniref:Uncharacterized protein n=1 Tax=Trema orientale TaxID=63057 RepID=A0A2P5FHX8_TREOI|nr:hypothetical protein TorRG33x02_068510 [Trema orientale]
MLCLNLRLSVSCKDNELENLKGFRLFRPREKGGLGYQSWVSKLVLCHVELTHRLNNFLGIHIELAPSAPSVQLPPSPYGKYYRNGPHESSEQNEKCKGIHALKMLTTWHVAVLVCSLS